MTLDSGSSGEPVVELWRRAFGQPPAIVIDTGLMLTLIESYAGSGPHASAGPGEGPESGG